MRGDPIRERLKHMADWMVAVLFSGAALLVGCALTPMPGWHRSHAVPSPYHDGAEYHSCFDGTTCQEGYACTRFGCEWCGLDEPNRCTEGLDGTQFGIEELRK